MYIAIYSRKKWVFCVLNPGYNVHNIPGVRYFSLNLLDILMYMLRQNKKSENQYIKERKRYKRNKGFI
jgi:hypothetical protein